MLCPVSGPALQERFRTTVGVQKRVSWNHKWEENVCGWKNLIEPEEETKWGTYSRKHACSMTAKILGAQVLKKTSPVLQSMSCFSQFPSEQFRVAKSRPQLLLLPRKTDWGLRHSQKVKSWPISLDSMITHRIPSLLNSIWSAYLNVMQSEPWFTYQGAINLSGIASLEEGPLGRSRGKHADMGRF